MATAASGWMAALARLGNFQVVGERIYIRIKGHQGNRLKEQ